MTSTIIKSLVFTIVTVLATAILASTIRNDSGGSSREYSAMFEDATSLNKGDDIRIAGVKIGTVSDVEVADKRLAKVTFTVSDDVDLTEGTTAQLRFRNVVGQRYIALELPTKPGKKLSEGHTFSTDATEPALDLTMLFNGFRPLFKLLNPEDVNNLSNQIIAVFQGEGATVDGLLSSTASLTSTIAEKDAVIGDLITNLNNVLTTLNDPSGQLDTTITTLQQLVSGLAGDRVTIGNTLDGLGDLTTSVAGLLDEGRKPLKGAISALGDLSENLDDSAPVIDKFLQTLPTKLDRIGRAASYGSWVNFYLCSIEGRIPMPEGYYGDLGAQPIAGRCR
ncbi:MULTISPECIES: MCE family protein [unclassified Nocardioides]|uniref:MCE family protein n=1 Tax=unclassified Nocardioides TaxID=2615069 RepID=UPI0006F50760|nr:MULTISPECIES: MCE family protein [unclassified Nocardioides]KQY56673.1 ABC transporter substrate-binding protein [Nocardioides sp. Root140]KQZ75433.1 ABC transporter substrate-binding protein [Nocardioides sp. Root151]KRF14508.1 ABC transporter substrate-binding protein [Nocardioides sp. Soil796]